MLPGVVTAGVLQPIGVAAVTRRQNEDLTGNQIGKRVPGLKDARLLRRRIDDDEGLRFHRLFRYLLSIVQRDAPGLGSKIGPPPSQVLPERLRTDIGEVSHTLAEDDERVRPWIGRWPDPRMDRGVVAGPQGAQIGGEDIRRDDDRNLSHVHQLLPPVSLIEPLHHITEGGGSVDQLDDGVCGSTVDRVPTRGGVNDGHAAVEAGADPIDSPQALHQGAGLTALRQEVGEVEVGTNLQSRCGHDDGGLRVLTALGPRPIRRESLHDVLATASRHPADHDVHVRSLILQPSGLLLQPGHDPLDGVQGVAEDDQRLSPAQLLHAATRLLRERSCRLAFHEENVHWDTVTMRPTCAQLRIEATLLLPVQAETGSRLLVGPPVEGGKRHGCRRHRHDLQARDAATTTILEPALLAAEHEQGGQGLLGEVRLVEDPERIQPRQRRIDAAAVGRELVAAEQQTGHGHIECSHDDGWARGVARVLREVPISISEPAAQATHLEHLRRSRDRESRAQHLGHASHRRPITRTFSERLPNPLRRLEGVIDDGAPVDNEMQSQGDHPPPTTSAYLLGILGQRVQPSDEDREGLAHPGRHAEVGRRLSLGESLGQAHLVVPGLMPSDLAEEVCEVQAAHINTPENLF